MEPFALLNLLKTLLPQDETKHASPPPQTDDAPANSTPPPSEPPVVTQERNAFLEFAQKHDERAKRTKK